jgi:hypothetical protein
MTSRYNKKMTEANRIRIPNTVTNGVGKRDSLRRYRAKRAITVVHEICSTSGTADSLATTTASSHIIARLDNLTEVRKIPNARAAPPSMASMMERAQLKQDYVSKLKPPKPGSRCIDCAREDQKNFGGTVHGYYHEDNPPAKDIGQEGHNFLVTPDQFLIDRWIKDVWGEKPIYDLKDPDDLAAVKSIYGNPAKWEEVPRRR